MDGLVCLSPVFNNHMPCVFLSSWIGAKPDRGGLWTQERGVCIHPLPRRIVLSWQGCPPTSRTPRPWRCQDCPLPRPQLRAACQRIRHAAPQIPCPVLQTCHLARRSLRQCACPCFGSRSRRIGLWVWTCSCHWQRSAWSARVQSSWVCHGVCSRWRCQP